MPNTFEALHNEKYISLETFKKDGNGVKTPVWVVDFDGKLYVFTDGSSYKVKRVGRNPKARVAACDMRGGVKGPWFDATARLVEDAETQRKTYEALGKKYGLMFSLLTVGAKLSGSFKRRRVIEVAPA